MSEMAGGPLWRGWAVALAFALLRRRFPGVDGLEDSEGQGLSGGGGAVYVPSESLGPRKGCSWLTTWSLPCFPEAKSQRPPAAQTLSISPEAKTVTSPVQASVTCSVDLVPSFLEAHWGFLDTFLP